MQTKLNQDMNGMSDTCWALLGLIVVLIMAGPSAFNVIVIALALGLLEMVIRLLIFVVKLLYGWVMRE